MFWGVSQKWNIIESMEDEKERILSTQINDKIGQIFMNFVNQNK